MGRARHVRSSKDRLNVFVYAVMQIGVQLREMHHEFLTLDIVQPAEKALPFWTTRLCPFQGVLTEVKDCIQHVWVVPAAFEANHTVAFTKLCSAWSHVCVPA